MNRTYGRMNHLCNVLHNMLPYSHMSIAVISLQLCVTTQAKKQPVFVEQIDVTCEPQTIQPYNTHFCIITLHYVLYDFIDSIPLVATYKKICSTTTARCFLAWAYSPGFHWKVNLLRDILIFCRFTITTNFHKIKITPTFLCLTARKHPFNKQDFVEKLTFTYLSLFALHHK